MKVKKFTIPVANDLLCKQYLDAIYEKYTNPRFVNIKFTYHNVASKLDIVVEHESFPEMDYAIGQPLEKLVNSAKFVGGHVVLED